MEKTVANVIPEKPEWVTLREKLECDNCKIHSCEYRRLYVNSLNTLIDCPKKACFLNFLFNFVSAIPVFFLFKRVFALTAGKFFLALFISLVILFFYDMLLVMIEKMIRTFFLSLEKKREKDYKNVVKIIEQLEKKKEEDEQKAAEKEKIRFQDVQNARTMYKEFKKLATSKAIKENFVKSYRQMLTELKALCDDLKIEHFSNATVKNLFKVYLPEVLETCQNFTLQYEKELLSPKELVAFRNLLKTAREKFIKVKKNMWEKETTGLYINMLALDEALTTSDENKEVRK